MYLKRVTRSVNLNRHKQKKKKKSDVGFIVELQRSSRPNVSSSIIEMAKSSEEIGRDVDRKGRNGRR